MFPGPPAPPRAPPPPLPPLPARRVAAPRDARAALSRRGVWLAGVVAGAGWGPPPAGRGVVGVAAVGVGVPGGVAVAPGPPVAAGLWDPAPAGAGGVGDAAGPADAAE